jgi:hypothetical protein
LPATLKIGIYIDVKQISMIEREKLAEAARVMREYLAPVDPNEFEAETGIRESDFCEIVPREFGGRIFAIDGSNVVVFDLGTSP